MVSFGVLQMQKLGFAFAQIDGDQPAIATDAVIGVHDRIADFQFRQVADDRFDMGDGFSTLASCATLLNWRNARFR